MRFVPGKVEKEINDNMIFSPTVSVTDTNPKLSLQIAGNYEFCF